MITKIIEKKNINSLLKAAAKDWDIYAPQKNSGNDVWFEVLPENCNVENIVLDQTDTVISPKDIFFPQLESLFEFNNSSIRETVESSPKLLFGVSPCDLKAMLFSDEFFKRNFEDKYYLSRAKNRFVMVIGCIKPLRQGCFCSSTGTGPFAKQGFDLQFIDNQDSYFVEIGSEKGREFTEEFNKYFKDALEKDSDNIIAQIKAAAMDKVELKVDFKKALDLMSREDFIPEENYKRMSERCIYCAGCLYVCPTCTCFNVLDNAAGSKGERLRNWDACVFEGYTRETSGHNPRRAKWLRTARRYEHKLRYDVKAAGESGCVGCGRCLSNCPVNIGISKFIQEITEQRKII